MWAWPPGGVEVARTPQPPLGPWISEIPMGPAVLILGPSQENLGEVVKEPERALEHCLPNFAGGQHFFEYLLVVSLKKKHSGEDYEPRIIYQFPKVRTEGRGNGGQGFRCLRGNGEGCALSLPCPPCLGSAGAALNSLFPFPSDPALFSVIIHRI